LTSRGYAQALVSFDGLQNGLQLLAVDHELVRDAGELAEQYALRGYDAVHLAAGLAIAGPVTFVTWDGDLAGAAADCGVAVAPAR
jgi:predicted nucleic acid-binding protein